MNIIGRPGSIALSGLGGFFGTLATLVFLFFYYELLAMILIVVLLVMGIRKLYLWHRGKHAAGHAGSEEPPLPKISRVKE